MMADTHRGPGRPTEGTPVLVRLRPDQIDRLDDEARSTDQSRAAVIRDAVDKHLPPA